MSTTPQNPIPQFKPEPGRIQPAPQGTPQKKKHTIWWIMGSCCAILIIAVLVLGVLGFAYRGRIQELAKKLSGTVDNTVANTTTYGNSVAENTTVQNSTGNTTGNTAGNTTSNSTTTPTNTSTQTNTTTTPSSGEKNVLVSAVTAKGIDTKNGNAKNVTSEFSTSDDIYYAVLEVSNLQKTNVSVDWYQNGEKVQTYVLKDTSGNKFVNFYLDVSGSDADARVGDYEAKVYFGTDLKKTLKFSVSK
jgi:hypothetical protein